MKKILLKDQSFGNFAYDVEVEVTDAAVDALLAAGVTQVLQRSPASAVEKALAGYAKRPSDFKRNSIAFTPDRAGILSEKLTGEFPIGDAAGPKIAVTVTAVTERVGGALAGARKDLSALESRADWSAVVDRICASGARAGIVVPVDADGAPITHDDDGEFSGSFCRAFLARKAELLAASL